jgi:hypothetical protein
MSGAIDLTEVERQLLMAAAAQGLWPTKTLQFANTAKVVNQVLRWRGLSDEQIDSGWRDEACNPEHDAVYKVLVRMVFQQGRDGWFQRAERPGPALFEGSGNWGVPGDPNRPPSWPHFNACRLTEEGKRLVWLLLEQHPEYRKSVELPDAADGDRDTGT